jgi:NifU-like protein involved in Fe-S cluster formation
VIGWITATSMYSAKVLDYFRHPRNAGEIAQPTIVVEATNPVCGDLLKLWTVVREGRIADATFKVEGCIPAVACASLLTEMIKGRSVAELCSITGEQIEAGLDGLPSASRHASALALGGLRQLIEQLTASTHG